MADPSSGALAQKSTFGRTAEMNPQGHKANGGAGEPQGVKLPSVPMLDELVLEPNKVADLPAIQPDQVLRDW